MLFAVSTFSKYSVPRNLVDTFIHAAILAFNLILKIMNSESGTFILIQNSPLRAAHNVTMAQIRAVNKCLVKI